MKNVNHSKLTYLLLFMAAVAFMRVLNAAQYTPWSNFTPIGAMALFGGAYGKGWRGYAFPLLTLFVSDLFINMVVYGGKYGMLHGGFYWIYGAMVLIVLVGKRLTNNTGPAPVLGASLAATLVFWLLVDFGVWLGGGMDIRTLQPLTRDWSGLLQCYLQGLPYIKNFLLGTMAYSAVLFGVHYMLRVADTAVSVK